jgi:hypothetical protein
MHPRLLFFLIVFCAVFSEGCKPEAEEITVQQIDEEFIAHVASFKNEAAARGYDVDFSNYNVEVSFGDLDTIQAQGVCDEISSSDDFVVTIDREIWQRLSIEQKENLIYHELGHCFLGRPHKTDLMDLGNVCSSLMAPGGFCIQDLYDDRWKEYYLDELFDESVTVPEWYADLPVGLFADSETIIDVQDTLLSSFEMLGLNMASYDGYEIAIEIPEQTQRIGFFLNNYLVHFNRWNSQSFYIMDSLGVDYPLMNDFRFPSGSVSSQAVGFSNKLYYYSFNVLNGNVNADFSISMKVRIVGESLYFYVNDKLFFIKKNDLSDSVDFKIPTMVPEGTVSVKISGLYF